jgi:predicted aspartyl protease
MRNGTNWKAAAAFFSLVMASLVSAQDPQFPMLPAATSLQAGTALGADPDASALVGSVLLPLTATGAGSLSVNIRLGAHDTEFLVDTGASMVTLSRSVYRRLERAKLVRGERQVAGRLADGRMQLMSVYRLEALTLSPECQLRDVEVLVLPGEGRNLLGLNVLTRFAPLTLHTQPLGLELSHCDHRSDVVAINQRAAP